MQGSFDFAAADLQFIRHALKGTFGALESLERRTPIWKMVRSLIGSKTHDTVAEPALERLMRHWLHPRDLAAASPDVVLRVIGDVTHAEDKAANLIATLRWIGRERPDYDLSFLGQLRVDDALEWLERFPGVGPKVAAATLNASTLRMRVFIVASHVHRILLRFGFIGSSATARNSRDAVTAAAVGYDADALLELFALMKALGQTFCRPFEARCAACPLAPRCQKKVLLGDPSHRRAA